SFLCSDDLLQSPIFNLSRTSKITKVVQQFNVIIYKIPPVDKNQVDFTSNQEMLNAVTGMPYSEILKMSGINYMPEEFRVTLEDSNTWNQLNQQKFDVIIADEYKAAARVLGAHFNVPVIAYINWGPVSMVGGLLYPINPSYMPLDFSPRATSDKMDIYQRFDNLWEYLKYSYYNNIILEKMKKICLSNEYIKPEACDNILDFYKTVSLVLMNRNDVLNYPAPFMPHMVSVEGFFLDKPKPLTGIYKESVEKSKEHGVIVVSFGSLFRKLPSETAEIFAKAFARMDQTVIWSYEGPTPEGLGSNTVIRNWIPQNDILAHPYVKLFVHQCGMSGTFETLNYAIPNIGIPFWVDQFYNCEKLANRVGSGKYLNLKGLTSAELRTAMDEVISNATYKKNAQKAADIYHNQPIDPKKKLCIG
ncbi:unnamed protein product, partial [Owenia fusiformis]